ncbi:MAG: hypothetical protein AB7S38_00090 [Vulcanimicrobiota bacterium]
MRPLDWTSEPELLAGLKALLTADASVLERWSGAPAVFASRLILELAAGPAAPDALGVALVAPVRATLAAGRLAARPEELGRAGAFRAGAGRLTLRAATSAHLHKE